MSNTIKLSDMSKVRINNGFYTMDLTKIIFNGTVVWERIDIISFTLHDNIGYIEGDFYYTVNKGTTWREFINSDDATLGTFMLTAVESVVFKPKDTIGGSDFWVVPSSGNAEFVFADDEINETEYLLILRARTETDNTNNILVYVGDNLLNVSAEGIFCAFVAPTSGIYKIYSNSSNAVIGKEINGDDEYFDTPEFEVELAENQQLIILCATKNWEDDKYKLIIEKI